MSTSNIRDFDKGLSLHDNYMKVGTHWGRYFDVYFVYVFNAMCM